MSQDVVEIHNTFIHADSFYWWSRRENCGA